MVEKIVSPTISTLMCCVCLLKNQAIKLSIFILPKIDS